MHRLFPASSISPSSPCVLSLSRRTLTPCVTTYLSSGFAAPSHPREKRLPGTCLLSRNRRRLFSSTFLLPSSLTSRPATTSAPTVTRRARRRPHGPNLPRNLPQRTKSTVERTIPSPRPRLEALRRRLRSDDDAGPPSAVAPDSVRVVSSSFRQPRPSPPAAAASAVPSVLLSAVPHVENTLALKQNPLVDTFGRNHSYLRISLVERCNLRCRYCMPPEGVDLQPTENLLTADEIVRVAKIFVGYGTDKIRLTGGEPLLRKDIIPIVASLSSFPSVRSLGITTNGLVLSRNLDGLLSAGLTHANISLDTLRADRFEHITRRRGLHVVLRAIEEAAEKMGGTAKNLGRVKVNCVVMRGFNEDELRPFVKLADEMAVDVRFIEWMPFLSNGWDDGKFLSYQSMLDIIQAENADDCAGSPIRLERIRDGPNDTTKWYRSSPSALGRIGFITSMSSHFCGTCNRLRLTSDGKIRACLFGQEEISLRDAMRAEGGCDDERLAALIGHAVQRKKFSLGGHGDMYGIAADREGNRPMTTIGG